MEDYILQLIEEIRSATWIIRPPHEIWEDIDTEDEIVLEDLSFVEQFTYGTPEKICDVTTIETSKLPPPGKLTDDQKGRLSRELEMLLKHFSFVLDFPEEYPDHLKYPFIRDFWDEEHVPLSFGENHIELCDVEIEYCPFPGYCTFCQEFEEEEKNGPKYTGPPIDVDKLLDFPDLSDFL